MMKKITSAALLSLALLLSACTPGTPTESVSADTSADATESAVASSESDAASSSQEETLESKAKALFTNLAANNNGTLHAKAYYTYTDTYFDGGMLRLYEGDFRSDSAWGYGEAKIANYGIAQFLYTNDTMGVDASQSGIICPNTDISYKEYNHLLADLGESGKNITWTVTSRTKTFSTDDSEFATSLLWLNGIDDFDDVSDEFSNVKAYFNLSEDGKSLENMGVTLDGSKSGQYSKITLNCGSIENIGTTTKNAKVDAYLKTNPTFAPSTAWDANTTAFIAEIAPGLTLPFPSQTSYAYAMPADEDSGLIYSDLGCGNKNEAYGAQLLAAGFTADQADTDESKNLYFYKKTFAPASGVHGEKVAYVGMMYTAATGEAATLYPNGIWRVMLVVEAESFAENVSLADVNAEFATKKLLADNTTPILPTLTLAEGCTQIDFIDGTADFVSEMKQYAAMLGASIDFSYCYVAEVHFYYPEASADAAIAHLSALLLAAGYTNSVDSKTNQPDTTTFENNAETGQYATLSIKLDKAMTSATSGAAATYQGFIYLAVTHFEFAI